MQITLASLAVRAERGYGFYSFFLTLDSPIRRPENHRVQMGDAGHPCIHPLKGQHHMKDNSPAGHVT